MTPIHIDSFYYVSSEVLCHLYGAFPVRQMLLVEDITGPIQWDITGLPDRRSRACFETLIWLSEHELLRFRSIEPRDIGIEGAVLTQKAFVLLTGTISWDDGATNSRVQGLMDARSQRDYEDLATIVRDILRANCRWGAPVEPAPLRKSPPIGLTVE